MWLALLISGVGLTSLVVAWSVRRHKIRPLGLLVCTVGADLAIFSAIKLANPELVRGAVASIICNIVILTLAAVLMLGYGSYRVWQAHKTAPSPTNEIMANVAIALGSGAAIAIGILVLQLAIQLLSSQQSLDAQRESMRLSISTQSDLSGFTTPRDPADNTLLDLSGQWFRGKKMPLSSLNDTQLQGANFVLTDLTGAYLRDANLSSTADGRHTDLRGASLYWSDLSGATIGDASFVFADLRRAYLCGVDLTQANLTGADLRDAKVDVDPEGACEQPASLPPRSQFPSACWPDEEAAHDWCGADARQAVCQRDDRVAQMPAPDPREGECR